MLPQTDPWKHSQTLSRHIYSPSTTRTTIIDTTFEVSTFHKPYNRACTTTLKTWEVIKLRIPLSRKASSGRSAWKYCWTIYHHSHILKICNNLASLVASTATLFHAILIFTHFNSTPTLSQNCLLIMLCIPRHHFRTFTCFIIYQHVIKCGQHTRSLTIFLLPWNVDGFKSTLWHYIIWRRLFTANAYQSRLSKFEDFENESQAIKRGT